MNDIERIAKERIADSKGYPSYVPFEGDENRLNERKGVAGEISIAEFFGFPHRARSNPKGDGGVDCMVVLLTDYGEQLFKIDVKSAEKPGHLIVEVNKVFADIYVLGRYDKKAGRVTELIGWQWASAVLKSEKRQRTKLNYEMHYTKLRPMYELKERFVRSGS